MPCSMRAATSCQQGVAEPAQDRAAEEHQDGAAEHVLGPEAVGHPAADRDEHGEAEQIAGDREAEPDRALAEIMRRSPAARSRAPSSSRFSMNSAQATISGISMARTIASDSDAVALTYALVRPFRRGSVACWLPADSRLAGSPPMTACIVGWSHLPFGKHEGRNVESLIVEAADGRHRRRRPRARRDRRDLARPLQRRLRRPGLHQLARAPGRPGPALQARDPGRERLRHRLGRRPSRACARSRPGRRASCSWSAWRR